MKIEVEVLDIKDKQLKGIEFEGIQYALTDYKKLIPTTQPTTRPCKKKKGKYYDKTYGREVTKDEMDAVKKAILHVENNYVPTTAAIAKQVKLKLHDVQCILHKMKQLDIVIPKRTKGREVIYRLKP